MKIEIKNRFSLALLFSHGCENNTIALTLAAAMAVGADLYGADLREANLYGATLYGADLREANLRGANLREANLRGADLYGANLREANLYGANLRGANLYGANLRGANLGEAGKLTGDRPYFVVGPIGSRQDTLAAFLTENGVFLLTSCFFGAVEEFRTKLQPEHGNNAHVIEYRAALDLIEAHFAAWPATPVEESGAN